MKKYKRIGEDVFEILEVKGKEVGVTNKTLPLNRQIQAYKHLVKNKDVA